MVGTMIGSGIFLSPAGILQASKSVGSSLCIWAGCGLLATLSELKITMWKNFNFYAIKYKNKL